MGQILLYVFGDVCHLINLQCLINVGSKDRSWSGDVVKYTVIDSLGKKEEENDKFFIVSLLPTDTEKGNKTHVKVLNTFSTDLVRQMSKKSPLPIEHLSYILYFL